MGTPVNRSLKKREAVAARVSAAFKARGYQLIQYGGATVEQYSRGSYTTGDVDLGFLGVPPSLERRYQIMKDIGCKQESVRLFILDEVVIDLGGEAEMFSSRFVEIHTPDGPLLMEAPEESLAQRVLMAVYPQENADQKAAALALMIQALTGALQLDWREVDRIAALPGFNVQSVVSAYKKEAEEMISRLGESPRDSLSA